MSYSRGIRQRTLLVLMGLALVVVTVITILFFSVRVSWQNLPDQQRETPTLALQTPPPAAQEVDRPTLPRTPTHPSLPPTPAPIGAAVLPDTGFPEEPFDQEGTLWAPYLEWTLENPGYEENPFDLIAQVIFTHQESGEVHTTEMFYAGGDIWKFRFTGTRTGDWLFNTLSQTPALHGHTGQVTIHPNPDPKIKGFLVNYGNKYARQVGENGELEALIFNIWQGGNYPHGVDNWYGNEDIYLDLDYGIENYVRKHGMTAVYSNIIANRWFDINVQSWDEHASENPDLRTFEALEVAISYLHSQGLHLHIWKWGDEDRRQTPIGVGGINGDADRRLQRYIAARLGPLPGWSMGYGFDLGEENWIGGDTAILDEWAGFMHEKMGWPHLLFSRGYAPGWMSGVSYSSNGPGSKIGDLQTSPNGPENYEEVLRHLESDRARPHLFEERFIYLREFAGGPPWTMERTRRVMWWNAMAGGAGAFWGVWDGPLYPNPEQMHTHAKFWEERFLLDMKPANHLSDGYVLHSPSQMAYVFYREDASTIWMDLSGLDESKTAVVVDTQSAYIEYPLGMLEPGIHTFYAPYEADWAVAVGFEN